MKQANGIDTRDTGLIAPRGYDGYDGYESNDYESTADVINKEIRDADPIEAAKQDAARLLSEGMTPEIVTSFIMLSNTGLRKADAVQIVNTLAGTEIDPNTFQFRIEASDIELGDAPEIEKKDPYLEKILNARQDAARILQSDTALDQVANIVALRNGIKREQAVQIISELTR